MDFKLASKEVERGMLYFSEKLGVVVSTSVINESSDTFTTLIYFLLEHCPLIAFVSLTRCLGFMDLSMRDIVRVSLNQSTKQPRDAASRIFFIVMVFLSLSYFSNVIAKITEIHARKLEIPLATSSDIVASGLVPQITDRLNSVYFKDLDESFDTLKSKIVIVKSAQKCLNEILTSQANNACFMMDSTAIIWLSDTDTSYGCPNLRFSEFDFFSVDRALLFEKGSPFVERFDQMIQRMFESGIKDTWQDKVTKRSVCYDDVKGELNVINDRHLLNKLLMILMYGYAMSAVVFLFELLYKYLDGPKLFKFAVKNYFLSPFTSERHVNEC